VRPLEPAPAFATATLTYDGKTTTVPMLQGEAILDAGERAGLVLPWSCRGGMCGTCRARLIEGKVTMAQNFALEPWETEAGYVLTCQSRPTSPHVVLDYDHV
jgi:ring-1,2-phenylacetyl-CoA epoxidase subunit PaaE